MVSQPVLPTTIDSPESVAARKWGDLTSYLSEWFFQPDNQALGIALSVTAAQFIEGVEPIWMFVIGPAGSGKTRVFINNINSLSEHCHIVGDLGESTLLSGFISTRTPSLLHQIGSGIMLFKDFSTFLSKRVEARAAIAGQLREVYDGSYTRDTGTGQKLTWTGKITVIAATTPAVERHWSIHRELGERFMQVRIARRDGIQVARYARRQQGREQQIDDRMRRLCKEFFLSPVIPSPPDLTVEQSNRIECMAEFVSRSRGTVIRDTHGARDIIDLPQVEEASRLGKTLAAIARFHAALFRRSVVRASDIIAARRVALNTIPNVRAVLIDALPKNHTVVASDELIMATGVNKSTLRWNTDELEALGVVDIDRNENTFNTYRLSPEMTDLWLGGFGE